MNASRLVRMATDSVLKNKLRSFLTMLGIIIGVAAVIVMIAIGEGARGEIRRRVQNLGSNMIVVTPGSANPSGVSLGAGSFNRLTVDDADKLRREGALLSAVSPVVITFGQIVGGQGNWRAPMHGVAADYPLIRDWQVEAGTFFDTADQRALRRVAVIGQTVAAALFPGEDPVGQPLRIRNVPFSIIGVLAAKGQTASGTDQDDVILLPYTTVQTRLSGRQFIAQILASTSSPEDLPTAQAEIREILREAHGLGAWEEDDFTVRNQTDLAEAAQETTEVMTLLLAAIASVSLVVGGIGIMNILLVSVTERTREIGLRMAVGARGSDVLTQFLVESLVMSVLGGLGGVVMGFGSALLVARATGWSVAVSPQAVVLALLFSGAVGLFFGIYPARQAATLNPIEALRHE
jgi:putative ABC transport system permease protein